MPAPETSKHDRFDEVLSRALRAEPYPTAGQRVDAWNAVRARAARQVMLPAAAPARAWPMRLLERLTAGVYSLRALRVVLLEEGAYCRAQSVDFGRTASFTRAPYVQLQPMW